MIIYASLSPCNFRARLRGLARCAKCQYRYRSYTRGATRDHLRRRLALYQTHHRRFTSGRATTGTSAHRKSAVEATLPGTCQCSVLVGCGRPELPMCFLLNRSWWWGCVCLPSAQCRWRGWSLKRRNRWSASDHWSWCFMRSAKHGVNYSWERHARARLCVCVCVWANVLCARGRPL